MMCDVVFSDDGELSRCWLPANHGGEHQFVRHFTPSNTEMRLSEADVRARVAAETSVLRHEITSLRQEVSRLLDENAALHAQIMSELANT